MSAADERPVSDLRLHESADLIPRMRPEEWNAFLADVDAQGVLDPLAITAESVILDGRHRWEAAKACGQSVVPVRVVNLTTVEQVQYIFRAALLRRHLSDDQRAILAARFREPLSKAMMEERAIRANDVKYGRSVVVEDVSLPQAYSDKQAETEDAPPAPKQPKTDTRVMVAQQFNVPRHKVEQATHLTNESPRLAEQVLAGDISLREAERERAKAAAVELNNLEVQAGIDKVPSVVRQRLRRKFTDAMAILSEIEPVDLVEAYTERDPEMLPTDLKILYAFCTTVNELLEDRSLRVIEGGRS